MRATAPSYTPETIKKRIEKKKAVLRYPTHKYAESKKKVLEELKKKEII